MQTYFLSIIEAGGSKDWLIMANFALSCLLCMWILRYRWLYLGSSESEKRHRSIINNLSEGIYHSSLDGRQLSANKSLVRLNGYDSEAEMLAAVNDIASEWYVDPGRRAEFMETLERDGRVTDFVSEIYRHKTRERIWITEAARLVRDERTGKPLYYEGSVREITETVNRLHLEERFQKLTSQVPGGLFQLVRSAEGAFSIPYASAGFRRLLGIAEDAEVTDPAVFARNLQQADCKRLFDAVGESEASLAPLACECRLASTAGPATWVHVSATPERENGRITWHGYVSDVSERKKHQLEIEDLAYFDPLTHLPNRRQLIDRLARSTGAHSALLFVDLDNFKSLNDTHGHDVGDQLLVKVAQRICKCVRARDMVARIGGDEFVVVLESIADDPAGASAAAEAIAGKLLASLQSGFQLGPIQHLASASVGVVLFDGGEAQIDELLKRADIAMYEAKNSGRNAVALFDPVIMARESERSKLLHDLSAAIRGHELELHYQPQVDHDGEIVGGAAQLRWSHPELGLMMPDRFMPLVEQAGLIGELGDALLRCGLRTLGKWQAEADTSHLRLALNVSTQFFIAPQFVARFRQAISEYGVDPSGLTLELTEHSTAKDKASLKQRMGDLKELGVRFSLGDFGTGYSSLAHLKKMHFDEVKIDGAFVADIGNRDMDRALLKTILGLADTLSLVAVAEHVETADQEAFLKAHGCMLFQGGRYGEALSADGFVERFRSELSRGAPPVVAMTGRKSA